MSKRDEKLEEVKLIFLRTTNDIHELNIIKEILDDNEIPYVLKDRGIGGYMRIISGNLLYGTDILVEESTAEKAKAILDEFPWNKKE